jgi:hypothetical protein
VIDCKQQIHKGKDFNNKQLIPLAVQEAANHEGKHLERIVDTDVMDNFLFLISCFLDRLRYRLFIEVTENRRLKNERGSSFRFSNSENVKITL